MLAIEVTARIHQPADIVEITDTAHINRCGDIGKYSGVQLIIKCDGCTDTQYGLMD
jgi:hypothetical protein